MTGNSIRSVRITNLDMSLHVFLLWHCTMFSRSSIVKKSYVRAAKSVLCLGSCGHTSVLSSSVPCPFHGSCAWTFNWMSCHAIVFVGCSSVCVAFAFCSLIEMKQQCFNDVQGHWMKQRRSKLASCKIDPSARTTSCVLF